MTGDTDNVDPREPEVAAVDEVALHAEVNRVLEGERTLWRAADRLVALAAPAVNEVCLGVPLTTGFNADIVTRTVIRRAHEGFAAICATVDTPARAACRVHMRAMVEDLIFVTWLNGLAPTVAAQFVQCSARLEGLRAIKAQHDFLPNAYQQLGAAVPELGFGDVSQALEKAKRELADLCQTQGWGKRAPSVRAMAEAADLVAEYDFFYFASSKAVHSNMHEMVRMVWGTETAVDISSDPMKGVHADLAVVYGAFLLNSTLAVAAPRLEPIKQLINSLPYSVWLAIILVGPARSGQLPLLIHPRELLWHSSTSSRPQRTT